MYYFSITLPQPIMSISLDYIVRMFDFKNCYLSFTKICEMNFDFGLRQNFQ